MILANYERRKQRAHAMIVKYGNPAKLRMRDGTERDCYALEVQLSPGERRALPANADGVYLVSAVGLIGGAPDFDKENLVILERTTGEEIRRLRMDTPAMPFAPGGVVIYWELNTRGATSAS